MSTSLFKPSGLRFIGVESCRARLATVTLRSSLLFDSDTDSLIESVVDSIIDSVVDSVNDSVNDLVDYPFLVYIEALVPYRINRVLILLIRFNSYGPGPTTASSLI